MTATLLAQTRPLVDWEWIQSNTDLILDRTVEHVVLTVASVAIGIVISLLLAVAALRWERLAAPSLALGGILYSIPALAAFALLVPFFGFTRTTAVIALTTYTVLILLRNILTGIDSVPDDVIEAARGQGYTEGQILRGVQLPLALPVIIAGVRVATVTVIGLVTVTALIGLGGLGFLILRGFRLFPILPVMIVVGTVLSVVLAVAMDLALVGLQRLLTPWARAGTT